MPKPKAEEITKMKERIASLSDDEREAVLEALEPDILKKLKALLIAAPEPAPIVPAVVPPEPAARKWWEIFS